MTAQPKEGLLTHCPPASKGSCRQQHLYLESPSLAWGKAMFLWGRLRCAPSWLGDVGSSPSHESSLWLLGGGVMH